MCAALSAPKVVLPLSTGAACLDGSPYAFYFSGNASSSRWSVYFAGGGWCYNESLCAARAVSKLGTSTLQPALGECECPYYGPDGAPDAAQCNCASLVYCDGASFSGFRPQPWPVAGPGRAPSPNNITALTFRGLRNLDSALDYLTTRGLSNASELVVTGGSAGGLSTFLHADRVAARAPRAKVRALPVVGYFLDHPEMGMRMGMAETETGGGGGAPDHRYRSSMDYVRRMQNVTAGPAGALSAACVAAYPSDEPWRCFMSPFMQAFVQTPFFMLNSKFDAWQLGCILDVGCMCPRNTSQAGNQCARGPTTCWSNPAAHNHSAIADSTDSWRTLAQTLAQTPEPGVVAVPLRLAAWPAATASGGNSGSAQPPIVGVNCNSSQRASVLEYGVAFMSALAPVLQEPRNGAFITSCICHGCDWGSLALRGKSAHAHFSNWYYGRTVGAGASAVDARGPNGDGAMGRAGKEPGWENCSDGFYPLPAAHGE